MGASALRFDYVALRHHPRVAKPAKAACSKQEDMQVRILPRGPVQLIAIAEKPARRSIFQQRLGLPAFQPVQATLVVPAEPAGGMTAQLLTIRGHLLL